MGFGQHGSGTQGGFSDYVLQRSVIVCNQCFVTAAWKMTEVVFAERESVVVRPQGVAIDDLEKYQEPGR